MQYASLEPWGTQDRWSRTGVIAAAVCNAAPFRGPGAKAVQPKEFVPNFRAKPDTRPQWKKDRDQTLALVAYRNRQASTPAPIAPPTPLPGE